MTNIWQDMEEEQASSSHETPVAPPATAPTAESFVIKDAMNEQLIEQTAPGLRQMMVVSNSLVQAAYDLSNYVPMSLHDGKDRESETFWSKKILPKLRDVLVDDIALRNTVVRSLGHCADLAVTINECAALVKYSNGSQRSLLIASEKIPKALQRVRDDIALLSSMNDTALTVFKEHSGQFLSIVGAEGMRKVADEVKALDDEIASKVKAYNAESIKLAMVETEMHTIDNLVKAYEYRIDKRTNAIKAGEERQTDLRKLISGSEAGVDRIAHTVVPEPVTRVTNVLWGLIKYTTTEYSREERKARRDYLLSIITAREEKIAAANKDIINEAKMIQMLVQEKDKEVIRLAALKKEFELGKERFDAIGPKIQQEIKELEDKLARIKADADNVISQTGLRGSVLLEFLVKVRTFSGEEQQHGKAFQPVISILESMANLVDDSTALLSSGESADVLVGGYRLLVHVGTLQRASSRLRGVMSEVSVLDAVTKRPAAVGYK